MPLKHFTREIYARLSVDKFGKMSKCWVRGEDFKEHIGGRKELERITEGMPEFKTLGLASIDGLNKLKAKFEEELIALEKITESGYSI